MSTLIPKYYQGATGASNIPISTKLAETIVVIGDVFNQTLTLSEASLSTVENFNPGDMLFVCNWTDEPSLVVISSFSHMKGYIAGESPPIPTEDVTFCLSKTNVWYINWVVAKGVEIS